jgi:Zn-dependent protease with chaperone function
MYLFIIAGLLSAMVALDQWGGEAPPDFGVAAPEAAVIAVVVGLAGLCLSAYILWRRGELAGNQQRFLGKVRILGRAYRLFVLAANGIILKQLGWAALAYHMVGSGTWDAPAMAIAAAPFVVLCGMAWTAVFWADRVLRVALFEQAGTVIAAGEWTLPRYLEFMFRQYLLVMLVPMLVLLGVDDVLRHSGLLPLGGLLGLAAMLVSVLGIVVLAGLWVRICWRTEPLPEGDLRRRLYGLAERAGVRVGNVLVWRTNNTMANGAMIGMIGPFRYIMITDALLLAMSQAPEEVEAVFAHEIAHVKYRHTLLFCGLLVGAVSATFLAGDAVAASCDISWAPDAAGLVVLLGYLAVVFGYISRRCELEADLYAVRSTECPAGCSPPSCGFTAAEASPGAEEWAAAPYGNGLCVHRILALTAALQRIARLNGLAQTARGWRHFSIARRVEVLEGLVANPAGLAQYERRIRRLKRVALAVSLALAVVAGVYDMALLPSEADNPEHPTRPEHVIPGEPMYYTRFVDRNQVDELALRSPEFDGDADAPPHLDDGRLAGLRGGAAAADDQVAVADARAHAVAVDAQGERARTERREARQLQVLQDPVGRRGG